MYRQDRVDRRGGGVLIAIKSSFSAEVLPINDDFHVEFIAVKPNLYSKNLFLCCSYVPPNSSNYTYTLHAALIKKLSTI